MRDALCDPKTFAEALEQASGELPSVRVSGFAGTVESGFGRLPPLRLGAHEVVGLPALVLRPSDKFGMESNALHAGILGTGWLESYRVTFDYPRRKVYLEPSAAAPLSPWPVGFEESDGGLQVAMTQSDLEDALELEVGDRIVAIAGEAAPGTVPELRDVLRSMTRANLTIERDGERREPDTGSQQMHPSATVVGQSATDLARGRPGESVGEPGTPGGVEAAEQRRNDLEHAVEEEPGQPDDHLTGPRKAAGEQREQVRHGSGDEQEREQPYSDGECDERHLSDRTGHADAEPDADRDAGQPGWARRGRGEQSDRAVAIGEGFGRDHPRIDRLGDSGHDAEPHDGEQEQ